jgi:pseudaminic acid synthase
MKAFSIGSREVGDGCPVLLVAELSANHGGKKDVALATIEAAAKAGADAIKLQTYTPNTLTLASDTAPFVVKTKNEWSGRTLHDLYREAMTPWEWHADLKACAESLGLLCFSTPFDATAVEFLEGLDVPAHKVASFELNDLPLIERIARTGKPVILSTGMATLGDIEAALTTCRSAGNEKLALLRCVSCYPAKPESMALASFGLLGQLDVVVGLSDHTRDATVAISSVALGARIIEKHFILDRAVGGPDAFFSLLPEEFRAMTLAVRKAEAALGTPRFGPSTDEAASTAFRRSLFVARDVEPGCVLTCDDVRSVRPADGLPPRHLPAILGRTAARALRAATPLTWDMVGPSPPIRLSLRPATADDADRLLEWRNDPTTRANSVSGSVVSRDDHAKWLASSLVSASRLLLLAEADSLPVGVVRLDALDHGAWQVSITVSATARGKGHAAAILRAVEEVARAKGGMYLVARIKQGNEASVRAFKRAGYYGFAIARDGLWKCERRLGD